ncbi:hypothetical protein EXIGLDRAFT_232776 [Exidia glandulosa HHB12029]|uniref:Uncharacterized protein n=1 Tax=Exidia glandulosa HHB12029 TaxID=1314781 RepID=A0A165E3T9_EXIGL|nr:hypothetical protein EXIGLDRAFT_232776 [Exidia glandulosa HHB12029]
MLSIARLPVELVVYILSGTFRSLGGPHVPWVFIAASDARHARHRRASTTPRRHPSFTNDRRTPTTGAHRFESSPRRPTALSDMCGSGYFDSHFTFEHMLGSRRWTPRLCSILRVPDAPHAPLASHPRPSHLPRPAPRTCARSSHTSRPPSHPSLSCHSIFGCMPIRLCMPRMPTADSANLGPAAPSHPGVRGLCMGTRDVPWTLSINKDASPCCMESVSQGAIAHRLARALRAMTRSLARHSYCVLANVARTSWSSLASDSRCRSLHLACTRARDTMLRALAHALVHILAALAAAAARIPRMGWFLSACVHFPHGLFSRFSSCCFASMPSVLVVLTLASRLLAFASGSHM